MAARKAQSADDVAYCKARLAFTENALAALAEIHLALKKELGKFEHGQPGHKPQRTRR